MNKFASGRFNPTGIALGMGVGAALCASSGAATGISIGLGLAILFGLIRAKKG